MISLHGVTLLRDDVVRQSTSPEQVCVAGSHASYRARVAILRQQTDVTAKLHVRLRAFTDCRSRRADGSVHMRRLFRIVLCRRSSVKRRIAQPATNAPTDNP